MAHDQEVVGSNPDTVYWMDVSIAFYYILEKQKIKVAKGGTPKKTLKKNARFDVAHITKLERLLGFEDGGVGGWIECLMHSLDSYICCLDITSKK
jgi:hypothetical protein